MAVAGFSKEDFGSRTQRRYFDCALKAVPRRRGVFTSWNCQAYFLTKFTLSDDVIIKGADLINGMLTISLERIVPEEKKSRMIEIGQPTETDLKKIN